MVLLLKRRMTMSYPGLHIVIMTAEGDEVRHVTIILIPEVGWLGMCDLVGIARRFGIWNNNF